MGIKNLHKFLRNKDIDLYKVVHLSDFAFKKIAVDVSLYVYKYKTILGDDWLDAFIRLIMALRRNEVHCVFIFDGKCPDEKIKEQQRRRETKDKISDRIAILRVDIDNYIENGEITENLLKISNKNKSKRLLSNKLDVKFLNTYLEKIQKQQVYMSSEDIEQAKELFTILDTPYYISETEAETLCAYLNKKGEVDAALSEDTDLLAYSTPKFLHKINTYNDTCHLIEFDDILESLEFTKEQFIDLCIMSGTDYNPNIPKVGNVTAYKLLKEHGSIENIDKDTSILNYKRAREIFTQDLTIPDVKFCGEPDWNKLKIFLKMNQSRVNIESIKKSYEPCEIVF